MNDRDDTLRLKRAALLKRLQATSRSQQTGTNVPPLVRTVRVEPLTVSWPQQRLWFLQQLDPAVGVAYHMAAAVRLEGRLDTPALQRALARVVARHESLRTTFGVIAASPVQRVGSEDAGFVLAEQDVSSIDPAQRDAAVMSACAAEQQRPFDLSQGPLIRGLLLRVDVREHLLLIVQHHIVTDGWSTGVLVRELCALYAAFSQGRPDPLPPLPLQYADYAAWQRKWLQGDVLRRQSEFWMRHLGGAPELLALPTDRPRPASQSHAGAVVPIALPPELVAALRLVCNRHGVTLFMLLLAAWSVLMSRLSGQTDVVVGTPVANRRRIEVESLIGFFVNTLALRVRLDDDPTTAELFDRIKSLTVEAYAHQDVPFELVVEALNPPRSLSHNPIFQVMFAFNNLPGNAAVALSEVTLTPVPIPHRTTQFDLSLLLNDVDGRVSGSIEYASDLFDHSTVERLSDSLRTVLHGFTDGAQTRASNLALMSAQAKQRLIAECRGRVAPRRTDVFAHRMFEQQAALWPELYAVVCRGESLSYAELNRRANRVAHALLDLGVRTDDRIAVCFHRGVASTVAVLGALKAGCAYVPLDPLLPAERRAHMLMDCAPAAVLTERAAAALVASDLPTLVIDAPESAALLRQPQHNPDPLTLGLEASHLAYVLYTSGTSGAPKGVAMPHGPLANLLQWHQHSLPLRAGAVVSQFASLGFDVSFQELFSTWASAGTVVIALDDERHDPAALLQWLSSNRVERAFLPVVVLQRLANQVFSRGPVPGDLRQVICAGEQLVITQDVRAMFGALGGAELHNHYGPTESHVVTSLVLDGDPAGWPAMPSIGRPIANACIVLLDRNSELVPGGVAGELHISGPVLARGYLNRPELDRERFTTLPALGERSYRTGDLARYRSDGTIEYLGRTDSQVKIRGFRIELGEIEAKLVRCPGVSEAVVVTLGDDSATRRVIAYLVVQQGTEPSAASLRANLAMQLPDYMLPSAFVQLDAIPLTANGKTDHDALPLPDASAFASQEYEAPTGDTELKLAEIWSALLGVHPIGRRDAFFELGGHSLLAVQLVSRLREHFHVEFPVRDVFARPKLADMAESIQAASKTGLPPLSSADRNGPLQLSFSQQRLWFIDQFDPAASAAYHMPVTLALEGTLDTVALKRTLDRVVDRHDILRTSIRSMDGEARQVIRAAGEGFPLTEVDLVQLDPEAQRVAVARIRDEETRQPFDLASGPLIRGRLLRLGERDHVLCITQHHIVTDAWSIGVMVREVNQLYEAFSTGREDPLPPLRFQYADFAAWQRQWLRDETIDRQIAYWKSQLRGIPDVLELAADRARPSVQSFAGGTHRFFVAASVLAKVKLLARATDTTLFMTLHAALCVLLARYSGQDDICIGAPVASRNHSDLEPLLGLFLNTVVLRTIVDRALTFSELLGDVRATALAAYANQDIPFEQLVDVLRPVRSTAFAPLFQVMLTVENTPPAHFDLPALTIRRLATAGTSTKFDLRLAFTASNGQLDAWLEYSSDLFDAATIERLASHFTCLLDAAASSPNAPIGSLPMLDAQERLRLLRWWSDVQTGFVERSDEQLSVDLPADSVLTLLERVVRQTPDATAVQCGPRSLSYGELDRRANQVANGLGAAGVKGSIVGLLVADRTAQIMKTSSHAPPERSAKSIFERLTGVTAITSGRSSMP